MEWQWLGGVAPYALLGLVIALGAAEALRPGRAPPPGGDRSTERRWIGNAGLYIATSLVFALPFGAGLAASLTPDGWRWNLLSTPEPLRFVLAFLALDALGYAVHRLSHAVGPLWRAHAVHHSDPEPDASTHLRHHPLELLVGSVAQAGLVLALGLTPVEVGAYAVVAWVVQLFAHTSLALPVRAQRAVGLVLVTPWQHEAHHSRHVRETDTNFGIVLSVWDRLFGTLLDREPGAPPIEHGLEDFSEPREQLPHRLLLQPFLRRPSRAGEARPAAPAE